MNKAFIMGRLTRDPEVRYTQGNNSMAIARYTLAVNRRGQKGQEQSVDYINIVAFGKLGEFAERYFKKGMQVLVTGHIQTGSYTNKDGQKVNTFDVIADDQEFTESKKQPNETPGAPPRNRYNDGFMNIPDGIEDDGLPFN